MARLMLLYPSDKTPERRTVRICALISLAELPPGRTHSRVQIIAPIRICVAIEGLTPARKIPKDAASISMLRQMPLKSCKSA